jgi:hypothetical protein
MRFQNLDISSAALSNPSYGRPPRRTTGHDLFLSQENRVQTNSNQPATAPNPFLSLSSSSTAAPHARHSKQHSITPTVGYLQYGLITGDHPSAPGASSGYLTPTQPTIGHGRPDIGQNGKRRSHTPAIGNTQLQQYAAGLRRPQSVQVRRSSRSSDSSSISESNVSNMKVQKPRDWRGFFKPGRVCASE